MEIYVHEKCYVLIWILVMLERVRKFIPAVCRHALGFFLD